MRLDIIVAVLRLHNIILLCTFDIYVLCEYVRDCHVFNADVASLLYQCAYGNQVIDVLEYAFHMYMASVHLPPA